MEWTGTGQTLPPATIRESFERLAEDISALAWPGKGASWLGRLAVRHSWLNIPNWMVPRADRRRLRVQRLVSGSALFDAEWYVTHYAQGAGSQADALRHLVEQGAARGYLPSPEWLGLGAEECMALGERYGKAGRSLWRYMRSQRGPGADVFLIRALTPLGPFTQEAFERAIAAVGSGRCGLQIDLLVIDHAMGGGANRYRDRRLADAMTLGQTVVLLTYHVADRRYVLELCIDNACIFSGAYDVASVERLLRCLVPRSVLVNNLASYPDLPGMLDVVRRLYGGGPCTVELPLHDYLAVCPSFNLLDDRRKFCGVPALARCRECIAGIDLPVPTRDAPRDIDAWRSAWTGLLDIAQPIVAFSHSSRDLLLRAYPTLDRVRVALRPHVVDYLPGTLSDLNFDAPLHIGVVGEISFAKGAAVVAELVEALRRRPSAARLSVIGTIDKRYAAGIPQTGRYRAGELDRLLAKAGVNVCLVPSIWPETFCYVAEELMRLEMPVAAFDLGAPAERLRTYARGHLLRSQEADEILDELATFWQALGDQAPETMTPAELRAARAP